MLGSVECRKGVSLNVNRSLRLRSQCCDSPANIKSQNSSTFSAPDTLQAMPTMAISLWIPLRDSSDEMDAPVAAVADRMLRTCFAASDAGTQRSDPNVTIFTGRSPSVVAGTCVIALSTALYQCAVSTMMDWIACSCKGPASTYDFVSPVERIRRVRQDASGNWNTSREVMNCSSSAAIASFSLWWKGPNRLMSATLKFWALSVWTSSPLDDVGALIVALASS